MNDGEVDATGPFSRFNELVENASQLHRAGETKQAIDLAKEAEALAVHVEPPQCRQAVLAFNQLGVVFFESGYARSAIPAYERSLAIAERLEPPDEDALATVHNNLGQAHQRLRRLPEAQEEIEMAVAIRRRISPGTLALACNLDNLGSILAMRGDLDTAEPIHLEAIQLFQQIGGPFDSHTATAFGNLSNVYHHRGDLLRAEAFRLRAFDAHERVLGATASPTLLDIASLTDIYRDKQDDASAEALINRLLSIGGDTPTAEHRNLAEMLRGLAESALNGGFRLDLAERLGTRAVELLESLEGPNAPETLKMLHLLANVHRAVGHLEAAEPAYHRARSGYEALQMRDETMAVIVDLGKFYRDTGSHAVAAELLRAALDEFRSRPESDQQGIASALGNLGLAYYQLDRFDEADAAFVDALRELQKDSVESGDRPWLLYNRGMLKYHLGEYDNARRFYKEAKQLWLENEGQDHPHVATVAANLALVEWVTGDTLAALDSFAQAERIRDRNLNRILAVGSEQKRAAYARELQRDLHQVVTFCLGLQPLPANVARFSAQMLFRRKGRVLDSVAHTLRQVHESDCPDDQAALYRLRTVRREIADQMGPVLISRRPAEDRHRLAELRAEEERLEATLSYRGALQFPGLEAVTLEEIQAILPPASTLVEMLRFSVFDPVRTGRKGAWKEERYAAVVVGTAGNPQWFDLGPASAIDALVNQWRSLLRRPSSEDTERDEKAARLHELLIAPLGDALSATRHLLVAGDGKLVLIPFGELRGSDGATLTSRFLVSYLSSGRDVKRFATDEAGPQEIIVIAAPDYEDVTDPTSGAAEVSRFADRGSLAPLPGTRQEAEEIIDLLEGTRLLIGREATVDAVRKIRRPLVLHVATHGIFVPLEDQEVSRRMDIMSVGDEVMLIERAAQSRFVNPMYCSGLALSGANSGAGILTAQQIAGLDLERTQLVVLSACETGLGSVKQGEEFAGLRRALEIAGAKTQVTSLWKVDDTATRALMGHYYRLLLDGHGRAEALQMAQSRVASDPDHPEWDHPAYSAAFISAGAWEPLSDRLAARGQGN